MNKFFENLMIGQSYSDFLERGDFSVSLRRKRRKAFLTLCALPTLREKTCLKQRLNLEANFREDHTLALLSGIVIHLGPPKPRESSELGISKTSTPIFLKALLV